MCILKKTKTAENGATSFILFIFKTFLIFFLVIPTPNVGLELRIWRSRVACSSDWANLAPLFHSFDSRVFDLCTLLSTGLWFKCILQVNLVCQIYDDCGKIRQLWRVEKGWGPDVPFCIHFISQRSKFSLWLPSAGLSFFSGESSISRQQPLQRKKEDLPL